VSRAACRDRVSGSTKALPSKSLVFTGTGRPLRELSRTDSIASESTRMNSLGLQDVFEPYYDGRKNTFSSIEPSAVDRARRIKERIEEARKVRRQPTDKDASGQPS
jgi:hypothetical protein